MLNIGIAGNGFVGSATRKRLEGKSNLFILDPPKNHNDDLSDCDIIFICINETSPSMENLEKLVEKLVKQNEKCFFVIRTTVIPGTTDYLGKKYNREFVFMPEFLREWNAEYDSLNPDKVIIGTEQDGIFRLLSVYFECSHILQVKPIEAELAKLALNSLATIKVVFAEELFDLAEKLKADYKNIYKVFELDQNINERHLIAGKDGYRGASGKCLKKDSEFMAETGKIYNCQMSLLETAVCLNENLLRIKKWAMKKN
jgi:UDPglucose 6-dehydrogenase